MLELVFLCFLIVLQISMLLYIDLFLIKKCVLKLSSKVSMIPEIIG